MMIAFTEELPLHEGPHQLAAENLAVIAAMMDEKLWWVSGSGA
jgi:hypothetical protein